MVGSYEYGSFYIQTLHVNLKIPLESHEHYINCMIMTTVQVHGYMPKL